MKIRGHVEIDGRPRVVKHAHVHKGGRETRSVHIEIGDRDLRIVAVVADPDDLICELQLAQIWVREG